MPYFINVKCDKIPNLKMSNLKIPNFKNAQCDISPNLLVLWKLVLIL